MTAPSPAAVKYSEQLLPCPFCGSTDLDAGDGGWITCRNCDAFGPSEGHNAGDWNTRASKDDFIRALIDECAKVASMQYKIDEQARDIDELRRKLAEAESENVRLRTMLLAEETVEL